MNITSINVEELAVILSEENPDIQFVDVREETEAQIAFLPPFKLLPLSQYEQWGKHIQNILNPDLETIVMCHHGIRSMNMCQWLISQGFSNVKNVSGGINAYAVYIDTSIPRY
ncbi:rhodanese-like domain-containing protein [Geminocystis sp. CENA526]|uniref:rhodanese-like domain-containing protein n=1 Tax=Geminocystis sp. CENA526 TaxID=1355871 RepID=UPI003D6E7EFE